MLPVFSAVEFLLRVAKRPHKWRQFWRYQAWGKASEKILSAGSSQLSQQSEWAIWNKKTSLVGQEQALEARARDKTRSRIKTAGACCGVQNQKRNATSSRNLQKRDENRSTLCWATSVDKVENGSTLHRKRAGSQKVRWLSLIVIQIKEPRRLESNEMQVIKVSHPRKSQAKSELCEQDQASKERLVSPSWTKLWVKASERSLVRATKSVQCGRSVI